MRRLVLIVLAAVALPGAVTAQTWGQPRYGGVSPAPYGQPQGAALAYGPRHNSGFGDPRAYRPPVRYGHGHDRGGRYGYSPDRTGDWARWSSPPGRGYHDVYGYNDDRAGRSVDHRRYRSSDCHCGIGAYLYDR